MNLWTLQNLLENGNCFLFIQLHYSMSVTLGCMTMKKKSRIFTSYLCFCVVRATMKLKTSFRITKQSM